MACDVTPSGFFDAPPRQDVPHVCTEMSWYFQPVSSHFAFSFSWITFLFADMDLASKDSYIQKLASKVLFQGDQEQKKRPFGNVS